MAALNKHIMIGNVGRVDSNEEKGYVKVGVAVNEAYLNKESGEWINNVQWFDVLAFGDSHIRKKLASLNKGDLVYVEGKVRIKDSKVGEKSYRNIFIAPLLVQKLSKNGTTEPSNRDEAETEAPAKKAEPKKTEAAYAAPEITPEESDFPF